MKRLSPSRARFRRRRHDRFWVKRGIAPQHLAIHWHYLHSRFTRHSRKARGRVLIHAFDWFQDAEPQLVKVAPGLFFVPAPVIAVVRPDFAVLVNDA